MNQEVIEDTALARSQQPNLLPNDENVQSTTKKEILPPKSKLCRYYRKGRCQKKPEECCFAHGFQDLRFTNIEAQKFTDSQVSKENEPPKQKPKPKTLVQKENKEIVEKKNHHEWVPSEETVYNNLYDYHFTLHERGEISCTYTQGEIDNCGVIHRSIRDKFHRDLQRGFVDLLLSHYNTRVLKKTVLEQFFHYLGWHAQWKHIIHKDYAYEIKSGTTHAAIVRQLKNQDFDKYMEDSIVKIIKEYNLLNHLPISPSLIIKYYYQYLGPLDPLLPSHHIYLRFRDIKSIDDYLDNLQKTEPFRENLANKCGKSLEELRKVTLFDHSNNEIQVLITQMRAILLNIVEKSHTGFILYSRYEEKFTEECAKSLQQFNSNIPQIKKLMMKMAFQENILVINLTSAMYLFSIDKFKRVNLNEIRGKYYKKLFSGCSLPASDHIALHQLPNLRPEKMDIPVPGRKTEEFLQKEIDLSKVTIVDSKENLKKAMEHFANINAIGVDLEGALHKHGRLELVQCSSRTHIFIFDIYQTKKLAKTDQSYSELYNELSLFLRNLIEDSRICKIFHDGRKDSEALHVFLDACPSNVFDLSAVFMLIEHLEAYKAQKDKLSEEDSQNSQQNKKAKSKKTNTAIKAEMALEGLWSPVETVNLPGLNDVLEKYQATHGINGLKETMKHRFSAMPVEYFLKRPIDKELLIYSARDVEDLIEMKEKMERKLRELLMFFLEGNVEEERVDILCKKVSRTYSLHGCIHKE